MLKMVFTHIQIVRDHLIPSLDHSNGQIRYSSDLNGLLRTAQIAGITFFQFISHLFLAFDFLYSFEEIACLLAASHSNIDRLLSYAIAFFVFITEPPCLFLVAYVLLICGRRQ